MELLEHRQSSFTQDTRFQTYLLDAYRQPAVAENINFLFDPNFISLENIVMVWVSL